MNRISHWIDGCVVASTSGHSAPVYDPATGNQTGAVDLASTAAEVDAAVAAPPRQRSRRGGRRRCLSGAPRSCSECVNSSTQTARRSRSLLTAEHGKVLSDSLGEVARGLENIEFACGIPQLIKGDYSEQAASDVDVYSIRQPLGVVAGITPFNFPAMVPMWMFANALACGNTFVLKPSEKDPSVTMFIAELLSQGRASRRCFNVVQGDKVAVDRLLEHDACPAVSFVGSTPIAKYIYETGTRNGKRVQALGGAKNHMLVFADADIGWPLTLRSALPTGRQASAAWRSASCSPPTAIADDLVADRRPHPEHQGR